MCFCSAQMQLLKNLMDPETPENLMNLTNPKDLESPKNLTTLTNPEDLETQKNLANLKELGDEDEDRGVDEDGSVLEVDSLDSLEVNFVV